MGRYDVISGYCLLYLVGGIVLMALSHVVGFGHFGEFLEFQQLRKVLKEL